MPVTLVLAASAGGSWALGAQPRGWWMRALEFGRTVLQSAPNGYSVVIGPDGTVLRQSGLGDPALLRETVALCTGLTPYARTGDTPVLVAAALTLLLPLARRRARPGVR